MNFETDYVSFAQVIAVKLWSTRAGVVSNDGSVAENSPFTQARDFNLILILKLVPCLYTEREISVWNDAYIVDWNYDSWS